MSKRVTKAKVRRAIRKKEKRVREPVTDGTIGKAARRGFGKGIAKK